MSISKYVLVASGPSGCGKGTVLAELKQQSGPQIHIAKSVTTRPPRTPSEDGYYFASEEAFLAMMKLNLLLETNLYSGSRHLYGTVRKELQHPGVLCTILEIDVNGLIQLQANQDFLRETSLLSVFLAPPSARELLLRLQTRGTEDTATMICRLEAAIEEVRHIHRYSHVLVTDAPPRETARKLLRFITEGVPPESAPFDHESFVRETKELIRQLSASHSSGQEHI